MSFYTSLTGLNSATAQLGVTSNNIANVGTTGFKRSRADFGDIFATSPLQKASSTIGQGVALKQVTQEFGQGNVAFSANALDLAITGDGFFPLKSADGLQDIYTRNGSFMMNDQYNVVNSAGQRLMAASVDSSGKADLGALNVLTIPQQTTGEAAETSLINLGLNFPADAQVITEAFNRENPATYNKSTALTVYDSGGNGYLATVYYAKTQNASQTSPFNKWQTYVFVGDTQVNPSLIQATDNNAERLYVNKYGEIKPESEVSDFLVNGKTQMFSLDDLTDTRTSQPAAIVGQKATIDLTADTTYSFANVAASDLTNMFTIDIDGTGNPVTVDLSDLAGSTKTMTGVAIAKELTNRLNAAFGDERYFDFTGNTKFQINATVGGVNKSTVIDLGQMGAQKSEKLTFSAADADGGTLTVAGVSVTVGSAATAAQVATAVRTALVANAAFAAATGRTVVDNADGSITINYPASEENPADVAVVDSGTSGVTSSTSIESYYVKNFTDITKVTKEVAANGMQTLINKAGLSTVAVAFDQVKGGFSFSESNGGAISLQAPQSVKAYTYTGTGVAANDTLTLTLVRGGVTTTLTATSLPQAASLDDLITKLQAQSAYATSGFTISNVDGKLQIARNDGASFTSAFTSSTFSGTLTDPATSLTAVGASAVTVSASAVTSNAVLGLGQSGAIVDEFGIYTPVGAALNGKVMPNGDLIRLADDQRYGLKVSFDNVNEKFTFSSGTTGDGSSISITNSNSLAESLLGVSAPAGTPLEVKVSDVALRGTQSLPAQTVGTQVAINVNNNFSVDETNNTFVVSVDDVKGTVTLPPSDTYTLDGFMAELEKQINSLASTAGSTVSGVKVTYDRQLNAFRFTTGTTGTNSFIKVSGSSNWGLSNVEAGRGSTSTWIKPTQFTDYSSGVGVAKYIDEFGNETSSADGFSVLPEWSPIYLDKGELTFNTSGNLISPQTGSQLDTVYLADGKGALTINIDYSASTQYSSAFAVLSQSQDGRPEGDLVGLNIGDDGLVSASYSNGSQLTLAKVILANFSSPAGLRQIGDSSFYATAKSGNPKIGEAGSAGFGTIRAGATERANVDLTQELVDLITAQRNFQANAKAIETSTTMTQAIIQIRT
jgi:flagellar hook-basal body protein